MPDNACSFPIIVNHLGFRPDDPLKRAVMPIPPNYTGWLGAIIPQVVDAGRLIRFPLESAEWRESLHPHFATVEKTSLGDFAVCDFSDLRERGGYQVLDGDRRSYPFLIYRDLWKRCFRLLLEWYRIASCGEAVPGYHEICHLDDCRMAEDGLHVDLVGGWHDAGDLRKWTSTMALVTLALTELVEEWPDRLDELGLDAELVWRQIERGAHYLLKMIDPVTGLVWHSIASDVDSPNECCVWTDNVIGTADDRGALRDCLPSTANMHVQTLAALARVLKARNPELAARQLAAARTVMAALETRCTEGNAPEELIDACGQLWRTTGEATWREQAATGLRAVLARQVTTAAFGQDRLRGYFTRKGIIDGNGDFRKRGGRSLYHHTERLRQLAQAILRWPEHPDAAGWKAALTLLLEGCIEPMIRQNPYLALPACLCLETDPAPGARPLAGQLRFRYFGVEAEGNNGELARAATSLALAARALGQPKWAAYGQKQLEWIFGNNPFETCMMTGLGYSQAAVFSYYVGQIPGGIINGFTGGREDDAPLLWLDRQASAMNMEYWSVHTAAVLHALAVLEKEPLS